LAEAQAVADALKAAPLPIVRFSVIGPTLVTFFNRKSFVATAISGFVETVQVSD
jgi:hypothetical protein